MYKKKWTAIVNLVMWDFQWVEDWLVEYKIEMCLWCQTVLIHLINNPWWCTENIVGPQISPTFCNKYNVAVEIRLVSGDPPSKVVCNNLYFWFCQASPSISTAGYCLVKAYVATMVAYSVSY